MDASMPELNQVAAGPPDAGRAARRPRRHEPAHECPAFEALAAHPIAVVVADQQLAGTGGIELLRPVGAMRPDTVRIVLAGYADITAVATAINGGEIYKLMIKPWDNGELRDNLWQAFRRHEELTTDARIRG